jgi:tetratricopeptide (TPR) repeat protein
MAKTRNKCIVFLIYVALAVTSLAAYARVYNNEFISFDDDMYVTANPHVQAGLTWKGVKWAFTTTHVYNWHPLTWLSHMLDCQLFGLNAGAHHMTSVLLHTANALLLFGILKSMTGALWPSAFVAALFALHPVHVESVAWASERKDLLSSLFWMLTIGSYVRYVRRPRFITYLATTLAFAVGLLAKQMLVTLPFVLLLLDYWPLGRLTFKRGRPRKLDQTVAVVSARRCILEKLPLIILSVIAAAIVYLVQQRTIVWRSFKAYPLLYRIENALVAYVAYIGKMVWPGRLAIFYPHLYEDLQAWQSLGAASLLVFITVVVLCKARRCPHLVVGWLWYLGTLVPVIGLIQVGAQSMADRYTYIPYIGIFIMVAWEAAEVMKSWRWRKVALGVSAGLVLSALAACTWLQLGHWRNNIALYRHAVTAVPNNWWAYNHLGHAFLKKQQPAEAAENFAEALRIAPGFPDAHYNLGLALFGLGKIQDAIEQWRQAIVYDRRYYKAHNNLGLALRQLGKTDQAIQQYQLALQINPNYAEAHYNLARAMLDIGNINDAITHFYDALRLAPVYVGHVNNLAWVLATHKHTKYYNPKAASLLDTLAAAYAADGRFQLAVQTAEKALALAQTSTAKQPIEDIRKHLQLYRASRPYIEPSKKPPSD